jgi:hypothetical protein
MNDPLATYLEDHLAGATYAIELLEAIRDQYAGDPLGQFAACMLVEVAADQATLKELAQRIGAQSSGLKGLAAWVAEKASRLKLKSGAFDGLGVFEALEFLALGILGKLALWQALAAVCPGDTRLQNINFAGLAARAEAQHARMENYRLEAARVALRASRQQ